MINIIILVIILIGSIISGVFGIFTKVKGKIYIFFILIGLVLSFKVIGVPVVQSYNLKKRINNIKNQEKRIKYLLLYEKYDYKKFKVLKTLEDNFIKQVALQGAAEEGFITDNIENNLKKIDIYSNVDIPKEIIEEKNQIEKVFSVDAEIYKESSKKYFIKFLYNDEIYKKGEIYVYKKIIN